MLTHTTGVYKRNITTAQIQASPLGDFVACSGFECYPISNTFFFDFSPSTNTTSRFFILKCFANASITDAFAFPSSGGAFTYICIIPSKSFSILGSLALGWTVTSNFIALLLINYITHTPGVRKRVRVCKCVNPTMAGILLLC